MPETENVARMAEILSAQLFSEFFWEKVGPINVNWPCEDKEKHKVETHPSDVVFWYDEPYSPQRTYVQCDLKSYSKSSITTPQIKGAIESLANQVSCAQKSEPWQRLYVQDDVLYDVCGLLFVYNHDGEYDKDFQPLLDAVDAQRLDIPPDSKVVVLGPKDVFWLMNVRAEVLQMRGDESISARKNCSYFHPQMNIIRNIRPDTARAATLEILTSPWIVLKYDNSDNSTIGIVVFYKGQGEDFREFVYIIDFLRLQGFIKEGIKIRIKTLRPISDAAAQFDKAVGRYNAEMSGTGNNDSSLATLVSQIEYSEISVVRTELYTVTVGMDYVR